MRCLLFRVVVIIVVFSFAQCDFPDLSVNQLSKGWTLSNLNGSISMPARVPGYALQTLYEHGIIEDPLSGYADEALGLSKRYI